MAHRRRRPRVARIFDEPPENADETWTHGAMLGGMCGYDDRALADSYFIAADALVDTALADRDSMRTRELVAPTLFLYRHGIELFLKLIVRPKKPNHRIDRLLGQLRRLSRIRYKQELPAPIADAIAEFCRYDPEGVNYEGPAPRPMDRAKVEMDAEGQIIVDTSVLYRWEKGTPGQFNDDGAYLVV